MRWNWKLLQPMKAKRLATKNSPLLSLLIDGVLFCNSREFVEPKIFANDSNAGKTREATVVLFVICNDVFAWGCADAESFTTADIEPLYRAHIANKTWGSTIWCLKKRNEQPQLPVKKAMQKDGAWSDDLDALSENRYDKRAAEL